ncbi:MAG: DUF342 domain-containing protein [Candidatus Marinimicrobia bacterium]|nr:DUF342 domain-containing protein [Candidatus Neomarinimicrobiota bacterium]
MKIEISEDKLKAYITIDEKDKIPSKVELMDMIWKSGVTHGIKENIINKLLEKKEPVKNLLIADGTPPVPGEDAKLVWYVDISTKPIDNEEDYVDLKELKLFEYVKKGQEIVSKLPRTSGRPGIAVTGEEIVIPGKDVSLPGGKNTTISEDGLTLYADIDGYAYLKNGKVNVDKVITVKNVDYSSGNIKTLGSLNVEGDVKSGFLVEAAGTVHIGGSVEAGYVTSKNGDVIIGLGIIGHGRARIKSGNNLKSTYIQDAFVKVKNDILVERYIINSNVECDGNVIVNNNEGIIRGGKVFAKNKIIANEIGSEQGILTEVGIAATELLEVEFRKSKFAEMREELNEQISLVSKKVAFLKLLKERAPSLSEAKIRELVESIVKLKELEEQYNKLLEEEKESDHFDKEVLSDKCIIVNKVLHRNVILTFGNYNHLTTKSYERVKVYKLGDELIFEKLDEEKVDGN